MLNLRAICRCLILGSFFTLSILIPTICQSAEINQTAPDLIIKQLDGHVFDLSETRGKVVIIHFWASWCDSCRQEMPILDHIYQKYNASDLIMIGLSTDRSQSRGEVLKLMTSFHFPAALLRDADTNDFGLPHILPLTYIIDKKGILRYKLSPNLATLTELSLEDDLLQLLK